MPKTLMLPKLLPLLASALLLTACATADPLLPSPERFAGVAMPVAPPGEALCDGAPCLSQREADLLFNDTIDAVCEANDRLAWLRDYFDIAGDGPACPSAP